MAIALIDETKENACRTAEANAIRAKTGSSASITYDFNNNKGFADAIAAIPTGGITVTPLSVTENGTYTAPSGRAYSPVTVDVDAGITPSGNIELTKQTGTDVTDYATASVRSGSVSLNTPSVNASGLVTASATLNQSGWVGSAPSNATLQLSTQAAKTVTPTESSQTAVASGKYTTGAVTVGAISNTYVGSGITRRDDADLTAEDETVTVPAGYYASSASKSVATATHTSPTASINSSTGVVTASHTQGKGFTTGGTTTGTLSLSTQGAKTVTPSTSSQTAVAAGKYTIGAVTVAAVPTETKTVTTNGDVTPTSGKFLSKVTVAIPVYDGSVS